MYEVVRSRGRLVNSKKGFSLVELLIAVALNAVLVTIVASALLKARDMQKNLELQTRDEQERWDAEKMIRSFFQQAIDLKYAAVLPPLGLNNWTSIPNMTGAIRTFDSDTAWGTLPGTHALAVFWREDQRSAETGSAAVLKSTFRPTGIYFQKPTPTTWGVLYIDQGLGGILSPDLGDLKFEGLVRVQINNMRTGNVDDYQAEDREPVSSFDIVLTFRKHFGLQKDNQLIFCPRARMGVQAQCSNTVPSRDLVRTIRVVLRNNIIGVSSTVKLPLAPLSSVPLPPVLPLPPLPITGQTYGARFYDQIHFFRPATPGGFL